MTDRAYRKIAFLVLPLESLFYLLSMGVVACLFLFMVSDVHASESVRFERPTQGVVAALVDQDDYYYHADGSKVTFYRKKDVYVINKRRDKQASNTMQRLQSQFQGRVTSIKHHRLGKAAMVRINNSASAKQQTKLPYNINAGMLKSLDRSIVSLDPVFANAKGQGDILVLPKFLVKLANAQTAEQDLSELLVRYRLRLERQAKVPGKVYSVALLNASSNAGSYFKLARQLSNDPLVAWAQPQFKSQPYQFSFEPSDPLFAQQWHLRNTGLEGSRCDTDCDANNAWDIGDANGVGAVSGAGTVIAIIDDGVDLSHPDLEIWTNPDPDIAVDNEGDGCINDLHGCDFVDDSSTLSLLNPLANEIQCRAAPDFATNPALTDTGGVPCFCQDNDGTPGPDGDPSPQPDSLCIDVNDGSIVEQDNHGTAVAGIAAAKSSVSGAAIGGVGAAFSAEVLPIRLISEFDGDPSDDFCMRASEAMVYAGRYADVINASWGLDEGTCMMLETVISDVVAGTLMQDATNISHRPTPLGSPVIFASGNNASGWVKVSVPVTSGEHAYEWRFRKSDNTLEDPDQFNIDDEVRIDDIQWSDPTEPLVDFEDFANDIADFTNACGFNACDENCVGIDPTCALWVENSDANFAFSGTASARINLLDPDPDSFDDLPADCSYSYLSTIKDGPAGEVSFWVWVSTVTGLDRFEFLVDGQEVISFGDTAAFGFVDNNVAYPANLATTIAVGASTSGDLSGNTSPNTSLEQRAPYSQYGPELDVVAPSSDQHLAITTTDRSGASGYDAGDFTNTFEGTSASAALVSGIAAAMIAIEGSLTTAQVRSALQDTADKIGAVGYDGSGRNDFYGHGRVNMFKALQVANGDMPSDANPLEGCNASATFTYSPTPADAYLDDFILPRYLPAARSIDFCPAEGALVENDFCLPILAPNNRTAVICL